MAKRNGNGNGRKRVDIDVTNRGERITFAARSQEALIEFASYNHEQIGASFTTGVDAAGKIVTHYFARGYKLRITLDKEA